MSLLLHGYLLGTVTEVRSLCSRIVHELVLHIDSLTYIFLSRFPFYTTNLFVLDLSGQMIEGQNHQSREP